MKKLLHLRIEIVSDITVEFNDEGGNNKVRDLVLELPSSITAHKGDFILLPPVYVNNILKAVVWRTLRGDFQEALESGLYSALKVIKVVHNIKENCEQYHVSLTL